MHQRGWRALVGLGAILGGLATAEAFIFSARTPIPGVTRRGMEQDVRAYGYTPSPETIVAAATITADACGGTKEITAASPVTTNTTNTFTAPGPGNRGCLMDVCNVGANAITLDANANFDGLSTGDVAVGAGDCIRVGSNGTIWRQRAPLVDN